MCHTKLIAELISAQSPRNCLYKFVCSLSCSMITSALQATSKIAGMKSNIFLFPVVCEEATNVPFSTYTLALISGEYFSGSQATYTCDPCYTGGGTITCVNGTWIGKISCRSESEAPVSVNKYIVSRCDLIL